MRGRIASTLTNAATSASSAPTRTGRGSRRLTSGLGLSGHIEIERHHTLTTEIFPALRKSRWFGKSTIAVLTIDVGPIGGAVCPIARPVIAP